MTTNEIQQGHFAGPSDRDFTWPNKAIEYEVEDHILGQGASATVHKAKLKLNNKRQCAIKKIDLEREKDESDVLKEIKTLSSFRHDNITAYYGCFLNKSKLWIIMELMDGASVHSILYSLEKEMAARGGPKADGKLSEPLIKDIDMALILRETLKGIHYLHSENCIHRDIKAQNILLNSKGEVKLADFGVSSLAKSRPKTFVGTPCWMAPEVGDVEKHSEGYDYKADIWSLGITCIEMITGKPPYFEMPPIKVILLTIQSPPVQVKSHCEDKGYKVSKDLIKLIENCLKKLPKERPTAQQILKHDGFLNSRKVVAIREKVKEHLSEFLKKEGKTVKQGKIVRTKASRGEDGKFLFDLDSTDDEAEGTLQVNGTTKSAQTQSSKVEDQSESTKKEEQEQEINPKTTPKRNTSISPPKIVSPINLKLRIRTGNGADNQLNDIGFPFNPETDTPDTLAQELCQASLVSLADQIVVSVAMAECLETGQEQTFRLNTRDENCESDVEELQGYARIYVDG